MVDRDKEFGILLSLEKQAGREAIVLLLVRYLVSVSATLAQLSAMKDSIDLVSTKVVAHRMCGACGSLGFQHMSALFDQMDNAADAADKKKITRLIAAIEEENASLELIIRSRYPEMESTDNA